MLERYLVTPIEIDEDGIRIEYGDVQVDVSHRYSHMVGDRILPTRVTGTRFLYFVPTTGATSLLRCRPSTYSLDGGIDASYQDDELVFVYDRTSEEATGVGDEFKRDLKRLKQYLGWAAQDVRQHNQEIEEQIDRWLSARREKVLHDRNIVANLGYPLRRSSGVPKTYVTPKVKRKVASKLPSVSTEPFEPEPALDMENYEHILSVVGNMVLVMERSPRAFREMKEEDLRHHFLVQLNGQYEGCATGETFNYEGRTDILIREGHKNVFIAECKFWTGPSGMRRAVDQLLGYTSWRDTKTALLIFNRDRKMSTVLEKIPDVVKGHINFKKEVACDLESGFRFILGHRNDSNREVILTVLAFDVPV